MSRSRTPKDDLWDELARHFGSPRTQTERKQFGSVLRELLEAGATVEEVEKACEYVKSTFDSPSVHAVVKWFTVAQRAEEKRSPQQEAIERLRAVE